MDRPKVDEGKRNVKTNGYKSATMKRKQNKKKTEADIRNKIWAQLSPNEQLAALAARNLANGGNSKKQIEKIKTFNTNR